MHGPFFDYIDDYQPFISFVSITTSISWVCTSLFISTNPSRVGRHTLFRRSPVLSRIQTHPQATDPDPLLLRATEPLLIASRDNLVAYLEDCIVQYNTTKSLFHRKRSVSHCRMRGIQQIDKAWRAINETRSLHVMALPLSEVGDMLPSVGPKTRGPRHDQRLQVDGNGHNWVVVKS